MGFQKWKKSEENQLTLSPQTNVKILTVLKGFFELFAMYKWNYHFEIHIGKKWWKVIVVHIIYEINVYGDPSPVEAFIF